MSSFEVLVFEDIKVPLAHRQVTLMTYRYKVGCASLPTISFSYNMTTMEVHLSNVIGLTNTTQSPSNIQSNSIIPYSDLQTFGDGLLSLLTDGW
jgi:hypothetical protein